MPDFSIGLNVALQVAAAEAGTARHESIEPQHLFIGLCSIEKVLHPQVLEQLNASEEHVKALRTEWDALVELFASFDLNPALLRREMRQRLGRGNFEHEANVIHRSPCSRQMFERAEQLAQYAKVSAVGVTFLLAALLEDDDGLVVSLLREKDVDVEALKHSALTIPTKPAQVQRGRNGQVAGGGGALLRQFGKDLTRLACEGKVHASIGRREEILQIVRTLSRDTKNNPLLIGDAGVGKTAIVEGLAWRVAQGKNLPGKRIIQLNVADLVAGTKYRGEFEERMQRLLREVADSPEVILFIDEIHTLVGAGGGGDVLDAANILKPALARGELRCIGATTLAEYRKHIEKDSALERRFQTVKVDEPTADEALEILARGYKERFEKKHQVTIESDALHSATTLSARYLPDRRLPDKAIDLLDEACARVATPLLSMVPGQEPETTGGIITAETIAQVLAEWTGVPVAAMTTDERERLLRMAEELKQRVIGQDQGCETVARAVQRARSGLKPAGRPISVLLFLGPTGVGKTELTKATAAFLFGSDQAMVRLDMSEFMEKHTVSRLIGAPPGYVGYEEEGQLTGALRRTPFCVVLLDEVEKAHPEVLNLFLQVFDDGRITDSKGHTVDATNALFIMTSNVGHEARIGFMPENTEADIQALLAEVRKSFRPEFLNRLDDTLVFNRLEREHVTRIARLLLNDLANRLKAQDIELQVSDAALDLLCEQGYNEDYGARELRRVIEQQVENVIAGMMLRGDVQAGQTIVLNVKDRTLEFVVEDDPEHTL